MSPVFYGIRKLSTSLNYTIISCQKKYYVIIYLYKFTNSAMIIIQTKYKENMTTNN